VEDEFIKKGYVDTAKVYVGVQFFRKIGSKLVGKESLDPLGMNGQVKGRQQQKEECQRNKDDFPAFFDNFAF